MTTVDNIVIVIMKYKIITFIQNLLIDGKIIIAKPVSLGKEFQSQGGHH